LPDGRAILRLDDTRYAYVEVDDAFLLVTSVRWDADRAMIRLNDDTEQELDYGSLVVGDNDALYCSARHGKLDARVTTKAYYVLAEHIEDDGESFVLRAGGRRWPIGRRAHASSST
jgi:hypothetical protein